MQQGLPSNQSRQEIAEALRFQQSLLKLATLGQTTPSDRKPQQQAESQARQLASWVMELATAPSSR